MLHHYSTPAECAFKFHFYRYFPKFLAKPISSTNLGILYKIGTWADYYLFGMQVATHGFTSILTYAFSFAIISNKTL